MLKFRTGLLALTALAMLGTGAIAQDINIGVVMPQTGPVAMIGTQATQGVEFAADQINAQGGIGGHMIKLFIEDDQAQPQNTVLSFNKLADLNKVQVVLTGFSGPSLALAPLGARRKILIINAGAQADSLAKAPDWLLNTIPTQSIEIDQLSKYLVANGIKKLGVLYENGATGTSGLADWQKSFPAAGGEIVASESIQLQSTEFRSAIAKIADAKPDAMAVVITFGLLQLAQQYKQLNEPFKVVGTTLFSHPEVFADPSAEGFLHTQLRVNMPDTLTADYKKKYGVDMEFFAFQYYNALQIVAAAAKQIVADGGEVTGQAVHDAIYKIKTFDTVFPVTFNSNTATSDMNVNVMTGGKDTLLTALNK